MSGVAPLVQRFSVILLKGPFGHVRIEKSIIAA